MTIMRVAGSTETLDKQSTAALNAAGPVQGNVNVFQLSNEEISTLSSLQERQNVRDGKTEESREELLAQLENIEKLLKRNETQLDSLRRNVNGTPNPFLSGKEAVIGDLLGEKDRIERAINNVLQSQFQQAFQQNALSGVTA